MGRYIRLLYILPDNTSFLELLNSQGYSFEVDSQSKTVLVENKYMKNSLCLKLNKEGTVRYIICNYYYLLKYLVIEVGGYLTPGENFRHSLFRKTFEINGGVLCEFKDQNSFDVVNLKSKPGLKCNEDIKFLSDMLELGYAYDYAVNKLISSSYEFREKIISEKNKLSNKRAYYAIVGI